MRCRVVPPELQGPVCFGHLVPDGLVSQWQSHGRTHVIAQAELLPVILARITWAELLRGFRVVYYIDNEGVREALVSGSSASLASRDMLRLCGQLECFLEAESWYARAPSPSNIAHGPSRLEFGPVLGIPGASRVEPVWPKRSQDGSLVLKWGG